MRRQWLRRRRCCKVLLANRRCREELPSVVLTALHAASGLGREAVVVEAACLQLASTDMLAVLTA